MRQSPYGFLALLLVIGVSIVFGMVLGGQVNAPRNALAAPEWSPIRLAPQQSSTMLGMTDFADIVEAALPAVVSVQSTQLNDGDEDDEDRMRMDPFRFFFGPDDEDNERRRPNRPQVIPSEGSGFLISNDGYLLTNHHVIEGADRVVVGMQDGRELEADVVGSDPSIDLALLKVDTDEDDLPSLPLGDSRALRVGEWVIAIGNPLDYTQTVTVGVVSAKERRVPIGDTDIGVVSFIQTDAAINFGNSGGPLIDARGNVVGINTAITRRNYAEGIGFALPIDQVRRVIEQLRERGYVKRGFIGITMNDVGIDDAAREFYGLPDRNGVLVREVTEDGPADKAGVREGDIIRKVDGDVVKDNTDLISKIASHQPGDKVSLEIFRRGEIHRLKATLIDREEELQARARGNRPSRIPEEPQRPRESTGLSITVENLSSRMRDRLDMSADDPGVIVTDVEYNSSAADKGIVPDMLIRAINDNEIFNVDDWEDALAELEPGTPVKLDIMEPASERTFYIFLRVPRDD